MKLVTTTTDTLQANQQLSISNVSQFSLDTWGNLTVRCDSGASVTLYSSVEAVADAVAGYLNSLRHCTGERKGEALAILDRLQSKLTETHDLLRESTAA